MRTINENVINYLCDSCKTRHLLKDTSIAIVFEMFQMNCCLRLKLWNKRVCLCTLFEIQLIEMWLFRFSSLTFIFRRFDTKMEIEKYDFLKYMTEDERSYILKISSFWKFVVGCVSIFLLVIGSLMKLVIYSFFSKKERHLDRPINSLILLDQVNIIKTQYF